MKQLLTSGIAIAAIFCAACAGNAETPPRVRINLCTGAHGAPYHRTGEYIRSFLDKESIVDLHVIETQGTWDNIIRTVLTPATAENIASGRACQAFIGQPDGVAHLAARDAKAAARLRGIGYGPREFLHVLCNRMSGVKRLSDLSAMKGITVALGPPNSGAHLVWRNFMRSKDTRTIAISRESGIVAINSVAHNYATCMLTPEALGSDTIGRADLSYGDEVQLVSASESDFGGPKDAGGEQLYRAQVIPSGTYPLHLQAGWFSGVSTVAWRSSVYIDRDYFADNQNALRDFIIALDNSKDDIQAAFGDLE